MSLLPRICIHLALVSVLAAAAAAARSSVSGPPASNPMAVQPPAPVTTSVPTAEPVPATPRRPVSSVGVNREPGSTGYVGVALPRLGRPSRSAEAVLIVPSKPAEPQTTEPLVEDLTIMSCIIQKNLADGYLLPEISVVDSLFELAVPSQNVGPHLLFPPAGRPKPMYVGGYGALFFLQVDFPLVPPTSQPQETGMEEGDPVWAEARRNLYEPPGAALPTSAVPLEAYSEEKVAFLRSRLVELMRHAGNIRLPDPNDWVTVVVRGTAAGDFRPAPSATFVPSDEVPCGRTILTLRARKSDIDQYAQGRLDQVQFEQRLQITISR